MAHPKSALSVIIIYLRSLGLQKRRLKDGIQSATESTHLFTGPASRGAASPNPWRWDALAPASSNTPWTLGVSRRTLNCTPASWPWRPRWTFWAQSCDQCLSVFICTRRCPSVFSVSQQFCGLVKVVGKKAMSGLGALVARTP